MRKRSSKFQNLLLSLSTHVHNKSLIGEGHRFPLAGSREVLLSRTGGSCECFPPLPAGCHCLVGLQGEEFICLVLQPASSMGEGGHYLSVSLWACAPGWEDSCEATGNDRRAETTSKGRKKGSLLVCCFSCVGRYKI